jgi:hypothetical protein
MTGMFRMKTEQPSFLRLALKTDLDEETAYTICQLISAVGGDIKGYDWDWEWFREKRGNYRSLINRSLAMQAWRLLAEKDELSLQTISDEDPRVSTVVPLEGMTNLRMLWLQNNYIADLQPLTKMSKMRHLNIYSNKVTDLSPLAHLQSLEILHLGENPVESFAALEQLPNLRWLLLSTDQVACFTRCKRLPSLQTLVIECEGSVDDLTNFPEMPSLKVLDMQGLKETAGIEQFPSLSTLELIYGQFSRLDGVEKLKGLTHLEAWSSQPLSLQPLSTMYALRRVKILAPEVTDLSALSRLPVLHEVRIGDRHDANKIPCNRVELEALNKSLTPWSDEFKASEKKTSPSLDIEIVSQDTFDCYDTKESFGIRPGECEDGMFKSEREWLKDQLFDSIEAMNLKEGTDKDFFVTRETAFDRTEGLVLYSLRAYESVREIVTAVQHILCEARNDWIIYFQALVSEGPDSEELPEGAEDFTVWIYPDKIMATEENAAILRELLN